MLTAAVSTTIAVMTAPMEKLVLRKRRVRFPLVIVNPRVKIAIGDIRGKVDHHNHGRNEKDDPLNDRKVPLSDRFENQPPDPRQMEDILDDDRACKKIIRLKFDQRHNVNNGISQGVPVNL